MLSFVVQRFFAVSFGGLLVCAAACPSLEARAKGKLDPTKAKDNDKQQKARGDGDNDYAHLPVPKIGVRQEDLAPLYGVQTHVWIRMPQIESYWNVLDLNIYEEPRDLVFLGHRNLGMLFAPVDAEPKRMRMIILHFLWREGIEVLILADHLCEPASLRRFSALDLVPDSRSFSTGHRHLPHSKRVPETGCHEPTSRAFPDQDASLRKRSVAR